MTDHPKPDELPGGELPRAVYRSVIAAFAWMILVSWITFGTNREADYTLALASVLMVVFLAIPVLIYVTASHHMKGPQETLDHFLSTPVETATGSMSGAQAWIEIAIIPVALALAATLIGLVYILS